MIMRILVSDFLFVEAHKNMNVNFIRAIAEFADTTVVSANGYYDCYRQEFDQLQVKIFDIKEELKTGSLKSRQSSVALMKQEGKIATDGGYDLVIVLAFETLATYFGLTYFNNIPLVLFYHKNIDELISKIKRLLYEKYKNQVYHVVFEDFFAQRLVTGFNIPESRVFVVPHPVIESKSSGNQLYYDCVGLCNSNEEAFIEIAIKKEPELRSKKISLLLRSKL